MKNSTLEATAPTPGDGTADAGDANWLRTLNPNEKRTLAASFSGYAVDAFDYYTLPLVTPILLSLWGMSKTEVGLIGTATLVASALGGWAAGILADRYGRVRILQLTILVFAIFNNINSATLISQRSIAQSGNSSGSAI